MAKMRGRTGTSFGCNCCQFGPKGRSTEKNEFKKSLITEWDYCKVD